MGFVKRRLHFIKGKTGNPENGEGKQFSQGPWDKVTSTVTGRYQGRASGKPADLPRWPLAHRGLALRG